MSSKVALMIGALTGIGSVKALAHARWKSAQQPPNGQERKDQRETQPFALLGLHGRPQADSNPKGEIPE